MGQPAPVDLLIVDGNSPMAPASLQMRSPPKKRARAFFHEKKRPDWDARIARIPMGVAA